MGRVEQRMYKRRRKRRRLWWVVVLAIAAAVLWLLLGRGTPFMSESIAAPTPTPLTSAFDQTVETREVTLAAETWFAIQTGVFSTQEAAAQKADAYTDRGAPGTVVQEGDKWRVFIACYASEADASAVRTRLGEQQRVETYLYTWTCPELRLRLTGMAGQLDVVEAGFTLLNSTAATLRDTAILLDAGQLTTAEAASAVNALDGQIALWEETVADRFGKQTPTLVASMLTITDNWTARNAALMTAAASATSLSAGLKSQAMALFDEITTWRKALAAS